MFSRGWDHLKSNFLPINEIQEGSLVGRMNVANVDGHISEVLGELGVVVSVNRASNNVMVWYFSAEERGTYETRLESLVLISK